MCANLDHLDNLDNLTQNPQQNRLFPDSFKTTALMTLIILPSTARPIGIVVLSEPLWP